MLKKTVIMNTGIKKNPMNTPYWYYRRLLTAMQNIELLEHPFVISKAVKLYRHMGLKNRVKK